MFSTTHCTALPGHGRSTANSASLLLPSFPCTHPDEGHCYPSTNTGRNLGLILLSFSWVHSLSWVTFCLQLSSCSNTALENSLLHCLPLSSAKWTLALLTILPDLTLPAPPVTCYHPASPCAHWFLHSSLNPLCCFTLLWLDLLFLFLPNNLLSTTFFAYLCLRAETSIRCFSFQRLPWVPREETATSISVLPLPLHQNPWFLLGHAESWKIIHAYCSGVNCHAEKANGCNLASNRCLRCIRNKQVINAWGYFIFLYKMKKDDVLWLSCLT